MLSLGWSINSNSENWDSSFIRDDSLGDLLNSIGQEPLVKPIYKDSIQLSTKNVKKFGVEYLEKNKYIDAPSELWKLELIFGEKYIRKILKMQGHLKLNETSIQSLFQNSNEVYYIDNKKRILLAYRDKEYIKKHGELLKISINDVLEQYGINAIIEILDRNFYIVDD